MGEVCVSGLEPGDYTVNETSPPPGYGDASETDQVVTVVNGTNCTDNLPGAGATATFHEPAARGHPGELPRRGLGRDDVVGSTINCVEDATDLGDNDATPTTGWDKSETHLGLDARHVRLHDRRRSLDRDFDSIRKRGPAQPAPVASSARSFCG